MPNEVKLFPELSQPQMMLSTPSPHSWHKTPNISTGSHCTAIHTYHCHTGSTKTSSYSSQPAVSVQNYVRPVQRSVTPWIRCTGRSVGSWLVGASVGSGVTTVREIVASSPTVKTYRRLLSDLNSYLTNVAWVIVT